MGAVAIVTAIALRWHPPQPLEATQKLALVASLYVLAPPILWKFVQVDGLRLVDFGFSVGRATWIALFIGFGLALLSLILSLGLQLWWGWVRWQPKGLYISGFASDSTLRSNSSALNAAENLVQFPGISLLWTLLPMIFPAIALALWIGGTEEFVFRGFVQAVLRRDYSIGLAATLTSGIFALTHLVWQPRATLPQLPGLWLLGMVLTLACGTPGGNLGLAIGLHGGWIFGLSSLAHLGSFYPTFQSPRWMTGGSIQPLTGLADGVMLGMVAGLLAIPYFSGEFSSLS
ncbi:MAG: CPBP family intramembrane metalloprotease [Oscillatoriales cyanobacterium RM2_1_1]|nr:CPBP family intramembrane metalloprotease [Oscillatoriales cyanobacterium RM2_1_1]